MINPMPVMIATNKVPVESFLGSGEANNAPSAMAANTQPQNGSHIDFRFEEIFFIGRVGGDKLMASSDAPLPRTDVLATLTLAPTWSM